ncbi:MAG TPA: aldo/keto reductase [Ktedonobacteraceae bacterium]
MCYITISILLMPMTTGNQRLCWGKPLGKRRQEVVIATKVGNRMSEALIDQGLSRQHIFASVQGSLKRLNTDYVAPMKKQFSRDKILLKAGSW